MKSFKFYIMLILLLMFVSQNSNSKEQISHGGKSQNIQAKGDVNTNYYKAGDKVATVKINSKNINKKTTIIPIKTNINIDNLKNLVVPNKLGFSEIFYNRINKNYYIKNHKYSTVTRLHLNKNINNNILSKSITNSLSIANSYNNTYKKTNNINISDTKNINNSNKDNISIGNNKGSINIIGNSGDFTTTTIYDGGEYYAPYSHMSIF